MNKPDVAITVWDSSDDPAADCGLVYRWNGWTEGNGVHSLLRYVETHGDRLRRKYLSWIHQLGESRVGTQRLIDHLALEEGLSFWWMTLFVEKSVWKSPAIAAAIRIFALEELILRQEPPAVRLVSANRRLHEVVSDLCRNLGVAYEWERQADPRGRWRSGRAVYQVLPIRAQALLSLARYVWDRWPLKRVATKGWFGGRQSLFCCSYFIHLDPAAVAKGEHHSYFWSGLPELLHARGYRINWLQHYFQSSVVPSPGIAADCVSGFNRQRQEQGFHTFLEAYLSWRVIVRVLARWFRLSLIGRRLDMAEAFRPEGARFSLWPLMRGDWQTSLSGPVAISNLLWIELFDAVLSQAPRQNKGLYLSENQAWERALIHAWRKHGHGQLIAVPHSTVRFWDLRLFNDPRTVRSSGRSKMPQADLVALNGKTAIDAYLSEDHPGETIVECEALRYGYLHDLRNRRNSKKSTGETRVLILGDFRPTGTIKMLRLLEAAVPFMSARPTYTVKSHPSYVVEAKDYPSLCLTVVNDPLAILLQDQEFDIAYSGNMTSAAVDAMLAGLPVIVMLDETELNLSALRGRRGVSFVGSSHELAAALEEADPVRAETDPDEFFFLDPGLPRWKRLLSLTATA